MGKQNTAFIPAAGCDALSEGEAVDVYLEVVRDPMGGDLPGGRVAKVAWIVLNRKDRNVNVVDEVFSQELTSAVLEAEKQEHAADVVALVSAKESGFCVGADLDQIYPETSERKIKQELIKVVEAMDRIANLRVPSVAFIHGSCLGGGYELALCCTIRTAAPDSVVGLPEVKIGMLPGAGGVIRLPRLIGVAKALDLILKGRTLTSQKALDARLVDFVPKAVTPASMRDFLWDVHRRSPTITLRRGVTHRDQWIEGTLLGKYALKWTATRALDKEVRGRFPAPYAALTTTLATHYMKEEDAVVMMVNATAALAVSSQTKTLMRLWQASRDVSKPVKSAVKAASGTPSPLVVVGGISDVSSALAVALKAGTFCMLCATTAMQRIRVVELLDSAGGVHLPLLQKTSSFEEGVPSPSGYGMLALVVETEEDRLYVEEHFVRHLKGSDWVWMSSDERGAALMPPEAQWARVQFVRSKLASAVGVRIGDSGSQEVVVAAGRLGCLVLKWQASRPLGVIDACVSAVYQSLVSCGCAAASVEQHLNFPNGTLNGCLPPSSLARLGLDPAHLPSSGASAPEKTRAFLLRLCEHLVALVDSSGEGENWGELSLVDSLFVMCFGWPVDTGGPLALRDARYADFDCSEYPEQERYMKETGCRRLLRHHPVIDSEADRKAWQHTMGWIPRPGLRDAVWPVLAYCVYYIATVVIPWVLARVMLSKRSKW